MLELVLTAVLVAPAVQADDKEGPDPALVTRTVEAVQKAYKSGTLEEKKKALQGATYVVHADVVAVVAKGLRDRDFEVKRASVEALRWMDHDDALTELHAAFKRKDVKKHHELYAAVAKSIGFHADPSSIKILSAQPLTYANSEASNARILGLGKTRTKKSLDALFKLMRKTPRGMMKDFMPHFRLSLMMLTGIDRGATPEPWLDWWSKNKKDFVVAKDEPRLPKDLHRRWRYYWGLDTYYERTKRREDRGDDPEGGGKGKKGG